MVYTYGMDMNWKKLSKNCRPFVAMPVHDGRVEHEGVRGLLGFKEICAAAQIKHDVNFLAHEALVSRARNRLVALFMAQPEEYTHLIFIDSDMEFEGAHIFQLINYNLDIVSGLASKKTIPLQPAPVFALKAETTSPEIIKHPKKNLLEALVVGGAFLCIKRSVIKKMIDAYPDLKYEDKMEGGPRSEKATEKLPINDYSYGLFNPINQDNKNYGEDNAFCKRWIDIGGKIWVDPEMSIGHIGKHNYKIGKLVY
jgi:hypothetical protein